MLRGMEYAIVLTRDDAGAVVVTFPDFPGAHAAGEYEGDALRNARDALLGALASCVRAGRMIPRPSQPMKHRIAVPPLIEIKLAIYEAMREAHVTRAVLARRLGWHRPQIDRLLNLRHGSKVDQLEAALAALGRRIVVRVERAAPS